MSKRKLITGAVILTAIVAFFLILFTSGTTGTTVNYNDFLKKAVNGQVSTITTNPNSHTIGFTIISEPDKSYTTTMPGGLTRIDDVLLNYGVPLDKYPLLKTDNSAWISGVRSVLLMLLPLIIIFGFWFLMSRRSAGAGGGMDSQFSFGRSNAKTVTPQKVGVTFSDVAGNEEAKQELEEVVEFLKDHTRFTQLGARIPKGVLLVGPPGTGKTLLAKAVAGEANVPFMSVSGSEFVEMFVGVGAARVRDLFARAKKMSPCIIFIDEVDALARKRGARVGGGTEEREQTLNQILVEMDGFDSATNIIIIAATNRADILDPAFLRPGRFDRQIQVDNPDYLGRVAILQVHSKGKPLSPEVDYNRIARQTAGFSGADLANLVNEAAILTARRNKRQIGMDELEESIDRVVAGPERKSRVISEHEKIVTAYHEVGHALCAKLAGGVDPVQKISIISRGRMGGYTRVAANEDRSLMTKTQLEGFMTFALGGHAAEELMFGEASTGPSNDIERVTQMARAMVTEYGMSRLGPVAYGENMGGRQRVANYSNTVAFEIDREVTAMINAALNRARAILSTYRRHLVALSNLVLEKEVISGDEMDALFEQVIQEFQEEESIKLLTYTHNDAIPSGKAYERKTEQGTPGTGTNG
ncbi:ATP-dependent zinc metalloprotease FtsH [Candidatus Chlorohelix sp.]|uniref:ATP-dependent zinc metalloprotease FtsH n=1 Tax=Candidatus Chlorohelix sp. TaxID=3139201 RepID=UPI0030355848